MKHSLKTKLTLPLISLMVIVILVVIGYVSVDKFLSGPVTIKNIQVDTKAALKLNVLNQISKKNGITEWELTAASATLLKNENTALLEDVSVIFFTKDKKRIHLTSENGKLNTKTHDMVFSGKAVVTYESSVLRTDKLHYNKKEHIIYSVTPVRLEKDDSVIEADSMTTRLNENLTVLDGNVKGKFSETFNIQ